MKSFENKGKRLKDKVLKGNLRCIDGWTLILGKLGRFGYRWIRRD